MKRKSTSSTTPGATAIRSLEIRRGRTAFPRRPLFGGRFLIGSGLGCDLRLGGDDIPPLHSLMRTNDQETWIEPIAAEPALTINGHVCHGCLLADCDVIVIGRFEFLVHDAASGAGSALAEFTAADSPIKPIKPVELTGTPEDDREILGALCAAELVDLIEREEARLEQFQSRRLLGADVLMHAALEQAQTPVGELLDEVQQRLLRMTAAKQVEQDLEWPGQPAAAPDDAELLFLHELEGVVEQLNGFSQELEQRSIRLSNREAASIDAAQSLLGVQKKLEQQLERLLNQTSALTPGVPHNAGLHRRVA